MTAGVANKRAASAEAFIIFGMVDLVIKRNGLWRAVMGDVPDTRHCQYPGFRGEINCGSRVSRWSRLGLCPVMVGAFLEPLESTATIWCRHQPPGGPVSQRRLRCPLQTTCLLDRVRWFLRAIILTNLYLYGCVINFELIVKQVCHVTQERVTWTAFGHDKMAS